VISVIIPFLNEAKSLPATIAELGASLSKLSVPVEVVFVDDGSTDDSWKVLRNSSHTGYKARLIRLSKNFGSHAALRAGISQAKGDFITFLYADLQDPPELVQKLHEQISDKYELVWANRESSNTGLREKIFSRLYAALMRRFAIPTFPEKGFDIVMFSRKIADILNLHPESNSSVFLQILSLGFSQTAISYERVKRKTGKSKWTISKKIKLFVDSFVAFSYAPIRLVSFLGFMFAFAGTIYAAYLLIRAVTLQDLQPGWAALISILMIGFGITNISLGILAEYLWRTLDVSRGRSVYIIDRVTELN
jgi:polyisoprenyl-phosphate glycosyltransferase